LVFGLCFLAAWVGSGLATAYAMRRAGHEFGPLAVLGFVLGPLFVPLAVMFDREDRQRAVVRVLSEGTPGAGPVSVAVGFAGSASGVAAAEPVLEALGSRLGRVSLVFALDYESVGSDDWRDAKAPAAIELELAAALLNARCDPAMVLVGGRLREAILRYARTSGYDIVLLVDGGRSLSRRRRDTSTGGMSLVVPVDPTSAR
jgi:hypothetical protein